MPIRLLIFDLDGTLVDTARDICEALNHATKPLGLPPASVEDTAALVGEGTTRLIEKALAPLGDSADRQKRDETLKRFLDYYSEHLSVHSRAYPNVAETLRRLGSFEKAVLSNKREALSRRLLDDLGLAGYFTLVAGSDTTQSRKPSPEPVRFVLERTGARPEEAIVVGDSPYDIEAARGAGAGAMAVTYGYRDRALLKAADHVIDRFDELIPLLLKLEAIMEKRREPRYGIPPVYRECISMTLKERGITIPARLIDLSGHGIMVETPVPLEAGFPASCELTIPRSLTHGVSFTGRVRHSSPWGDEAYIAGIEVESVSSEVWFRVFKRILDFISARPEVYREE